MRYYSASGVVRQIQKSCLSFQPKLKYLQSTSRQKKSVKSFNLVRSLPSVWNRSFNTLRSEEDTIFALSTASGRSAIAIIRVSGPACLDVYKALCPNTILPKARYASLRTLCEPCLSPAHGKVLDSGALVLYFPAPNTVTGEDVIEFHVHGGPAIIKAVLAAIPKTVSSSGRAPSIRYAEPGEFTRRAFYNDRLDLTQIEALGDALAAETEQQHQLAVRGTTNALSDRYESWRQKLLLARGELEALIDFSEEQHFEDSPTSLVKSVSDQVKGLMHQIQSNIKNASRGELLRNGISIALLGAPNAGKSSLLNRIVGREAAIVSKEAGTTRDVVEVNMDIGGFFCKFGDLAGLRGFSPNRYPEEQSSISAIGEVEEEGIRRAKERALTADVVIVVLSIENGGSNVGKPRVDMNAEVLDTLARCDLDKQQVICIINKSDLITTKHNVQVPDLGRLLRLKEPGKSQQGLSSQPFFISCKEAFEGTNENSHTGGIQAFLSGLIATFKSMTSAVNMHGPTGSGQEISWEESLGASERQRLLLVKCQQKLEEFLGAVSLSESEPRDHELDIVLAAESLRVAGECLAKITGKGDAGDVEEVLGVVFEKFCVGK